MRLHLDDASRIFIDLRATGLLRAVAHSPTLTARPERLTVDFAHRPDEADGEATLEATFRADAIEAPADIPAADREQDGRQPAGPRGARRAPLSDDRLSRPLRGDPRVGDALGRSAGTRRAAPGLDAASASRAQGGRLVATGAWQGRLTDLGIRPFKALLGAIKLEDWIAVRLDLRFDEPAGGWSRI